MNVLRRAVLPILASAAWISALEFGRNEWLVRSAWTAHYRGLGLVFPSGPVNGAIWGLWSLLFAAVVFAVSRKFPLCETAFLCWVAGFVLMWIVVRNLGVLPAAVLPAALPLSLLETFVAAWIVLRLSPARKPGA
jgi:hypothetical protein